MIYRSLTVLALVLFVLFSLASAQTSGGVKKKRPGDEPLSVKTNVLITDTDSKHVDDVRLEDIKLFENEIGQEVTGFSKNTSPLNLEIVVDNTGSMRDQLEKIDQIGRFITSNLEKNDEAQVIRFVGRDKISILNDWSSDISLLNETLGDMYIEGGQSAVIDGVMKALDQIEKKKKSADGRYAIVLISDLEDRASYFNQAQLNEKAEKAGVPIFIIALTRDLHQIVLASPPPGFESNPLLKNAKTFASDLALKTGGSAYFPDDKGNSKQTMADALKMLAYELRSRYTLSYVPVNQQRDGKIRKLRIEIADGKDGSKRTGVIKGTFTVPGAK